MELQEFIEKFAEQLEETDQRDVKAATKFRELEEWSSLTALSVIAMVDEEYNVRMKGEDIRNSFTIEDLFNVVKSKA